jgi:hypothetical protein
MRAGLRLDPWNARDFQPASRSITANCCMDHRHRQPASAAPASGSRSTHRGDDQLRPTLYVSVCRLGQRHRRTGPFDKLGKSVPLIAPQPVQKRWLNERLRRGGSKRRGLEALKYSVVGSQESVPEKAILMLLRPNMIDALTLAG